MKIKELKEAFMHPRIQSLNPYRDKQQFQDALLSTLKDKQKDYLSYFLTINFMKNSNMESYKFFFKQFEMKICKKLIPRIRGGNSSKTPFIIVCPERTPNRGHIHFHGVLSIHKDHFEKFEMKCLLMREPEFIEVMQKWKFHHFLKDDILEPYTERALTDVITSSELQKLTIQSYRLYNVENDRELKRIVRYSFKGFPKSYYTENDILVQRNPISIH